MKSLRKGIFITVGLAIGLGVIGINTLILWYNAGFHLVEELLYLGIPSLAFTWTTMALCGVAIRICGQRSVRIVVIVLVCIHIAASVYLWVASSSWREGAEYARLFALHLTFATLVLSLWVLRPLLKSTRS